VLVLVKERRGRRVVPVFVLSSVERENRLRTEVPPISRPMALPSTVKSMRSSSTSPTFVVMTGDTLAAFVEKISTFVK
jgi:hypothetical protein